MTYRTLLSAALAMALFSCSGESNVATVEMTETPPPPVATDGAPASGPVGSSADRFGMVAGTAPAASTQIQGTKPAEWQEAAPSSMRIQNYTAGPENAVEVYLTVLPGGGGGVEANLNRWRTQMGQAAYTAEELAALQRVPVMGQEAVIAEIDGTFQGMSGDLNNENYKMLGAIYEFEGAAVFVKMTGPADQVSAERERFLGYVQSLQSGVGAGAVSGELPPGHPPIGDSAGAGAVSGELPPGHPPIGGDAGAGMMGGMSGHPEARKENLEWTLPAGWERGEDRPVRLANFTIANNPAMECYVTVLPEGAGGIEANVNLWRQQLGQAALTTEELTDLPQLEVLGQLSPLVEVEGQYADMSGELHENYMLIGVIRPFEDRTVFVKMVGPADAVRAERDNFVSFCQSLKLPAESAAGA